jgi:argininosuccinate lyase
VPAKKRGRNGLLRERFFRPLDRRAADLNSSVEEDRVLVPYDILGSVAHARMLARVGLLPRSRARRLVRELRRIYAQAKQDRFVLNPALEDVHMNVEAALSSDRGEPLGSYLHAGRSRNDQVATDLLLYLRERLLSLEEGALALVSELVRQAQGPSGRYVFDGWTHTQPAQKVYLAQILLAHAHRFLRDSEGLAILRQRIQSCPLGSGALAGSSLPLDRSYTARILGFESPTLNSIDAVSDRDVPTLVLGALALLWVHTSSLTEELILGSLPELDRLELDDAFVTTSSLMPHKRNPDIAELLRAEASDFLGANTAILAAQRGLPLAYNRDLQFVKAVVIRMVERTRQYLPLVQDLIRTTHWKDPTARTPASDRMTWTVELADELVRRGVPFRRAHARVARWVKREGSSARQDPARLERTLREAFPEIPPGAFRIPSSPEEPERRTTWGGSSWKEVRRDLAWVRSRVERARLAGAQQRARWESWRERLLRAPL